MTKPAKGVIRMGRMAQKMVAWMLVVSLITFGQPLPLKADIMPVVEEDSSIIPDSMTLEEASEPEEIPPEMMADFAAMNSPAPLVETADPVRAQQEASVKQLYDAYFRVAVSNQLTAEELKVYADQLAAGVPLATVKKAITVDLGKRKTAVSKMYTDLGLKAPVGLPLATKMLGMYTAGVTATRQMVFEENKVVLQAQISAAYTKAIGSGLAAPQTAIDSQLSQLRFGSRWATVSKAITADVTGRRTTVTNLYRGFGITKPTAQQLSDGIVATYTLSGDELRDAVLVGVAVYLKSQITATYGKTLKVAVAVPPELVDPYYEQVAEGMKTLAMVQKEITANLTSRKSAVTAYYSALGLAKPTAVLLAAGVMKSFEVGLDGVRVALFEANKAGLEAKIKTTYGVVVPDELVASRLAQLGAGITWTVVSKSIAADVKARKAKVTAMYKSFGVAKPTVAQINQGVTTSYQVATDDELRQSILEGVSSYMKTQLELSFQKAVGITGTAVVLTIPAEEIDPYYAQVAGGTRTLAQAQAALTAAVTARKNTVVAVYQGLGITSPVAARVAANVLAKLDTLTLHKQIVVEEEAFLRTKIQGIYNTFFKVTVTVSAQEMAENLAYLKLGNSLASLTTYATSGLNGRKVQVSQIYTDLGIAPTTAQLANNAMALYGTATVEIVRGGIIQQSAGVLQAALQTAANGVFGAFTPLSGEEMSALMQNLNVMSMASVKAGLTASLQSRSQSVRAIYAELELPAPAASSLAADAAGLYASTPEEMAAELQVVREEVIDENDAALRNAVREIFASLGRNIPAAGDTVGYFVDQLGEMSMSEVDAYVTANIATIPFSTAELVSIVYQAILGRDPTAAEVDAEEAIPGQTEASLRLRVATSPEAASRIEDLYQRVLSRSAESHEQSALQSSMVNGNTFDQATEELIESQEATDRIVGVYDRVLDRAITTGQLAAWQEELKNGESYLDMVRGLINSSETEETMIWQAWDVRDEGVSAATIDSWQQTLISQEEMIAVYGVVSYQGIRRLAAHDSRTWEKLGALSASILNGGAGWEVMHAWMEQLANGKSWEQLVNEVMASPEAQAVIDQMNDNFDGFESVGVPTHELEPGGSIVVADGPMPPPPLVWNPAPALITELNGPISRAAFENWFASNTAGSIGMIATPQVFGGENYYYNAWAEFSGATQIGGLVWFVPQQTMEIQIGGKRWRVNAETKAEFRIITKVFNSVNWIPALEDIITVTGTGVTLIQNTPAPPPPAASNPWQTFLAAGYTNGWTAAQITTNLRINVTPENIFFNPPQDVTPGYFLRLRRLATAIRAGTIDPAAAMEEFLTIHVTFKQWNGWAQSVKDQLDRFYRIEMRELMPVVGILGQVGVSNVFTATDAARLNATVLGANAILPDPLADPWSVRINEAIVIKLKTDAGDKVGTFMFNPGLNYNLGIYNQINSGALQDLRTFLDRDPVNNRNYVGNALVRMFNQLQIEAQAIMDTARILGADISAEMWGALDAVVDVTSDFISELGFGGIVAVAQRVLIGVIDTFTPGTGYREDEAGDPDPLGGLHGSHGDQVSRQITATNTNITMANILKLDADDTSISSDDKVRYWLRVARIIRSELVQFINTSFNALIYTTSQWAKAWQSLSEWAAEKNIFWFSAAGNDDWTRLPASSVPEQQQNALEDNRLAIPSVYNISVTTKVRERDTDPFRGRFKNSHLANLAVDSTLLPNQGTSYATPTALAEGVRAYSANTAITRAQMLTAIRAVGHTTPTLPATAAGPFTATEVMVRGEYFRELGYFPNAANLNQLSDSFEQNQGVLAYLRLDLKAQGEAQEAFITSEYQRMLARAATDAEQNSGRVMLTDDNLQTAFGNWLVYTAEATAKLNGIYTAHMGASVPVTTAELDFYRDRLNGTDLTSVTWEIQSSLDYRKGVIEEVHVTALELVPSATALPSATITGGVASLFSMTRNSYQGTIVDANLATLIPVLNQIYLDRYSGGDPNYPVDQNTIDSWLVYLRVHGGSLNDLRYAS